MPDQIINSAVRALSSLTIPGVIRLILLSAGLTFLILLLLLIGLSVLLAKTALFIAPSLEMGADILGMMMGLLASMLLLPVFLPLIATLFLEKTADLIERHEYAISPSANPDGVLSGLGHDVKFVLTAVGLNLLCLPLYFIPLLNLAVYYGLNGYLIGREFFVMVAERHGGRAQAEALRKQHGLLLVIAGASIAFCANLPLVNLVAPFLGIALMVHVFHHLAGTPELQPQP